MSWTGRFGGYGGQVFSFNKPTPGWRITKVMINCWARIDRIQLQMTNGIEVYTSDAYGGSGGEYHEFVLADDD